MCAYPAHPCARTSFAENMNSAKAPFVRAKDDVVRYFAFFWFLEFRRSHSLVCLSLGLLSNTEGRQFALEVIYLPTFPLWV